MEPWMTNCRKIDSINPEISFCLYPDFYYGLYDTGADLDGKLVALLKSSDIPRARENEARTFEVRGHEEALAEYYKQVICLAAKDGESLESITRFFWMRLSLVNPLEKICVRFPWHDFYDEFCHYFTAVVSAKPGKVYSFYDQGWEIEFWHEGSSLYLKEGDTDGGIFEQVSFPRETLISKIDPLKMETEAIIANLSQIIECDMWTTDPRNYRVRETLPPIKSLAKRFTRKPFWRFW